MTLKIPRVFAKCCFCTDSSCNYCSRRMWPLSEEQMIIDHWWPWSGKKAPVRWSVLKWGPGHNKIFISCADGFKDINCNLIFLVLTDWKGFSLHSLWSEKSRFWTLEECNFQCIIPMMAHWFQYLLYSLHVLFIFLAVGRHQSLGTADTSLSPWGGKSPHIHF